MGCLREAVRFNQLSNEVWKEVYRKKPNEDLIPVFNVLTARYSAKENAI